jgi:hypothetical protein
MPHDTCMTYDTGTLTLHDTLTLHIDPPACLGHGGGGGGAGGLILNTSHPVTPGAVYAVIVGAGGDQQSH